MLVDLVRPLISFAADSADQLPKLPDLLSTLSEDLPKASSEQARPFVQRLHSVAALLSGVARHQDELNNASVVPKYDESVVREKVSKLVPELKLLSPLFVGAIVDDSVYNRIAEVFANPTPYLILSDLGPKRVFFENRENKIKVDLSNPSQVTITYTPATNISLFGRGIVAREYSCSLPKAANGILSINLPSTKNGFYSEDVQLPSLTQAIKEIEPLLNPVVQA